ncbi:MAG: hypothetical protein P1U64_11800 [Alcanivoracaceae bacterium]|nr:hypothetical protein [Alcanivoracaceae bacterium]
MTRSLRSELILRLLQTSHVDVLRSMGYRQPAQKEVARLENVIASEDLGLASGGFDFRFSDEEFLKALCAQLGIGDELVDAAVQNIREALAAEKAAFKPWLWVETGFRRTSQPVFALSLCEPLRRLRLEENLWQLPFDEQILRAGHRIREHMAETGGELDMWGVIQQYWFFYAPEKSLVMSRNGDVIGEREGPESSRASTTADLPSGQDKDKP